MRYHLRILLILLAVAVFFIGLGCLGLSAAAIATGSFVTWTPMIALAIGGLAMVAVSAGLIALIKWSDEYLL